MTPAPAIERLVGGFGFVEAPRVLDDGAILFSELMAGGFYRFDGTCVRELLPGRRWIGGAVPNADGSIILSGEGGIVRLDPATGETTPILSGVPAVNDMEADDEGAIFAGTVDFPAILDRKEKGAPGQLLKLDPDGTVTVVREGLTVSNGIGFSPDRGIFYHSDCTTGVWASTYARGGIPRDPVLFAPLEDSDGLVVDAEGGVWVARWQTGTVQRYRPDGVLDREVTIGTPNAVSLAFGGPDLDWLHVATGGPDGAGGIVRFRVDVPGQPPTIGRL